MARKELEIEDDIIDLTELIESGNSGDKRAAKAYAKAAAAPAAEQDDFESLLAQAEPPEPAKKVDADEALDMSDMGGIDNLLESLEIPPQPGESKKAGKSPEEDLDSALDELFGAEAPASPEPELGDLLDDMPSPEPALSKKAASPGPSADLDADLDDILSSFDSDPKPAAPAASSAADDISADLDDILNEVAPPAPEPVQEPAPEVPSEEEPEPIKDAPIESGQEEPELDFLSHADVSPASEAAQETILEKSISDEPTFPEAPSDLLMDEEQATIETSVAQKPENPETSDLPDKTAKEEAAASQPERMPALGTDSQPAPIQTSWPPEVISTLCRNLSASPDASAQQSLQGFARELGEQSAHVEDLGGQLEQLAKRVMACESRLSAARVKIAALEKSLETTAALDDLLREGTPLHTGFMGLIASAVANALQAFQAERPQTDPEVMNRLDALSVRVAESTERVAKIEKYLEAKEKQAAAQDVGEDISKLINNLENSDLRISALEKRLTELNGEIGSRLEKTAASAAAKILQEEIAHLLQEGHGI